MEEAESYVVELTPEAEMYFLQVAEFLSATHSSDRALEKSIELLDLALSLDKYPQRGSIERKLAPLGEGHRFLVYHVTSRKTIKVIYLIDEEQKKVFITDFFETEMNDDRIADRNK